MKTRLRNNKSGFTLIEIIISIALASILLVGASGLFSSGLRINNRLFDEFTFQSDFRYANQFLNRTVRRATVVFAISEDDFDQANLSDGWSYYGLSEDKQEILLYEWRDGAHHTTVLVPKRDGIHYALHFEQQADLENERIIKYVFKAYNDAGVERIDISSNLETLSAIHVVDRQFHYPDAAVAIAFRTDPNPVAENAHALITFVLDTSGSMLWDLEGLREVKETRHTIRPGFNVGDRVSVGELYDTGWYSINNNGTWQYRGNNPHQPNSRSNIRIEYATPNRMDILIEESKRMINTFYDKEMSLHVNIIEFDSLGIMGEWKDLREVNDKDDVIQFIGNLEANGGTNTGDGLRRAYYAYQGFYNDNSLYPHDSPLRDKHIAHYIIVLVDGVTTQYSETRVPDTWWGTWQLHEGPGNPGRVAGLGNQLDARGEDYVRAIGDLIKAYRGGPENTPIIPFVIGFSNKWESGKYVELESVNTIAEALWNPIPAVENGPITPHLLDITNQGNPAGSNPTRVFWAGDQASLENIFNVIVQRVEFDFWQISGP